MNMQKLPSDIIGLSKVMPPLSRRGFMSSSAAAAAGYTLAAGPVRADAIQTDTNGLKAGMADVAVTGGNMPVYFARPANVQNPPVILVCMEVFGLHEWVKDITRRIGHLGALGVAPNYYFRSETGGVDLTKFDDDCQSCSRSSTPRPTPSCSPISTPPWPGRSRRAATPTSSASWASAAAAATFGTTRRTIPT